MTAETREFDYIVVGGGTAGVAIASRLSQYLPSAKIALLEAGPNAVDNPNVTNPNNFMHLIPEGIIVDYSTTPQEHCDNRQFPNFAGRMLSGASGVNVGVWMRASSTDYRLVAERAGNERFGFDNMVKYFKRAETHWDKEADPKFHGFDGPVHTVGGRKYPLREVVRESFEKMGHRYNPDGTKGDPTGLTDLTQCYRATSESSSERQHSGKVYDLTKVHIRCDAPVAKILLDSAKRTTGVELVSGERLHARKEVVVSCGAQKTPQILMLSGIGPPSELSKHDIPLRIDSPSVGQNLFDHSSLMQYFKLKHPERGLCLPFDGNMRPEYGQGFPWEFHLFSHIPPSELGPVLAQDDAGVGAAHPHLRDKRCHYLNIPMYFPILATPEYNPDIVMGDGKHVALTSLHLLPISRGTVTLQSANPSDNPVVDPRYFSTPTDRYILRRAVRTMLQLTETEPLASELDGETPPADPNFPPLTSKSSDEEIDKRIRGWAGTIYHAMGTCALGTVLDSEFRVKGAEGLRVCDASVFPEPIGAMPSHTVYALGELCADLVAGRV
ncbi:GMC oxidoreductase [Trematosphaeria pertusa]|uniref:GMC oxidoreductase n=1 Tax=Trematosphaeria pertusa TaxID=390896 RepID=A0A6A6I9H0_9PLEO|nr:GMC oxidoreductase [Trematosphaeria pertusa]KAF2247021.1 GMC oxidoreductase [Trematosphaeria pertusa]